MWDLIVSVPDHCLSFYFSIYKAKSLDHEIQVTVTHIYFEVKSCVVLTHNPKVRCSYIKYSSRYKAK